MLAELKTAEMLAMQARHVSTPAACPPRVAPAANHPPPRVAQTTLEAARPPKSRADRILSALGFGTDLPPVPMDVLKEQTELLDERYPELMQATDCVTPDLVRSGTAISTVAHTSTHTRAHTHTHTHTHTRTPLCPRKYS